MIKKVILLALVFGLFACAGKLETNNTLYANFSEVASDGTLAVFYNVRPTYMEVSVKNVGSAFMTGLAVSFVCKEGRLFDSFEYQVGNLKPYFSKQFAAKFSYDNCSSVSVNYTYFPTIDGGFVNDYYNAESFPPIPPEQMAGQIILK